MESSQACQAPSKLIFGHGNSRPFISTNTRKLSWKNVIIMTITFLRKHYLCSIVESVITVILPAHMGTTGAHRYHNTITASSIAHTGTTRQSTFVCDRSLCNTRLKIRRKSFFPLVDNAVEESSPYQASHSFRWKRRYPIHRLLFTRVILNYASDNQPTLC